MLSELRARQFELHRLGKVNRVTFDAGKECFCALSSSDGQAGNFKVLRIEFDPKLSMRACVQSCVQEAGWRYRSILRTHRFFKDAELVGLFKADVLSYFDYGIPAEYHAASSTLLPLNNVLSSFRRSASAK